MESSQLEHDKVRAALEVNPADPQYVHFAGQLIDSGEFTEAVNVCLAGLSKDQTNILARLTLAQAFFELGYIPFAIRELFLVQEQVPENKAVARLLALLGAENKAVASNKEEDVAEVEFEV